MKSLESLTGKSGKVWLKPAKLLALAGIAASICVFFLAAWLYRFPERLAQEQALQRADGIVNLAAEIVVRPVQQLRNSLALMAKNPDLRQVASASVVVAWQQKVQGDLLLLLDSYEPFLGHLYEQILEFSRGIDYFLELPSALARRLATIAGMSFNDDESGDPPAMLAPTSISEDELMRMNAQTDFVRAKVAAARQLLIDSCGYYLQAAVTIERLAGFGSQSLRDVAAVEDFFSAALNDEMLRAITLRSLDGEVLAITGDVSAESLRLDARDCRAIAAGSIFFSGPVGYDTRRKHALWWVAVPVRDENRNPVACLTAFIDVDFLCRAAEKIAETTGSRLIFSDLNGVVIGHADRETVAKQVNVSRVFPSFVREADRGFSCRFVRHDGRLLLQAGKSIRYGNVRHLPDWYVYYEHDLTGFATQSQFLVTLSVILLAAMGMYALSCCVVRLF